MEKQYIIDKYRDKGYEKVNINTIGESNIIREGELFYLDRTNNVIYPSESILDKENEEEYRKYYTDFNYDELVNSESFEPQAFSLDTKEQVSLNVAITKDQDEIVDIVDEEPAEEIVEETNENQVSKEEFLNKFIGENIPLLNAAQNESELYNTIDNIINVFGGKEEAYEEGQKPFKFTDDEIKEYLQEFYDMLDYDKKETFRKMIDDQRLFNVSSKDLEEKELNNDGVPFEEIEEEQVSTDTNSEGNQTGSDDSSTTTDEPEEDVVIDMNGPEITKYREELAALESKLAELEGQTNEKSEININQLITDELGINVEFSGAGLEKETIEVEIEKEENNLKVQQEELKFMERDLAKYQEENNNAEYIRQAQNRVNKQKELIATIENKIESFKKGKDVINIKVDQNILIDTPKIANLYDREIKKSKELIKLLNEKEKEYHSNNMGVPLDLYKYQDQLNNIIEVSRNKIDQASMKSNIRTDSDEFKDLMVGLQEIYNVNNNISNIGKEKYDLDVNSIGNNAVSNPEIDQLKEEIEQRKSNIKAYEEILNDIKHLQEDVQNGLDPESEEFKQRIEDINRKKEQLPENLKNELDKYLDLINKKGKEKGNNNSGNGTPGNDGSDNSDEPDKEDDPEKNKTDGVNGKKKGRLKVVAKKALKWIKEHKMLCIGIGLAAVAIGLYLNPTTHMMINSALWAVGQKSFSAATLNNLHNANLAMSKAVAGGKYAFEGISGLYTVGGAAGAQALYSGAGASLIGLLTGLTGVSGTGLTIASIVKSIKNKIKNGMPEKDKEVDQEKEDSKDPEEKEASKEMIEKLQKELEEIKSSHQKEMEELRSQTESIANENKQYKEMFEYLAQHKDMTIEEAMALKNQELNGELNSEEMTTGRSK